MPNRVVHFEIEAMDKDRASNFYSQAFGWEMERMGEYDEMGGYIVVKTGDPKDPGAINGGLFQTMNGKKEINAFSCTIAVDDVNASMEAIKKAGGKILSEKPDDIPGVGLYVKCEDTEGNRFTLLQPNPRMSQE
jgi:predicted enzyme related to lactoylglutathione lyase